MIRAAGNLDNRLAGEVLLAQSNHRHRRRHVRLAIPRTELTVEVLAPAPDTALFVHSKGVAGPSAYDNRFSGSSPKDDFPRNGTVDLLGSAGYFFVTSIYYSALEASELPRGADAEGVQGASDRERKDVVGPSFYRCEFVASFDDWDRGELVFAGRREGRP